MADLIGMARTALSKARKGTSTKDAAELLRRELTQKTNAQWVVQKNAAKADAYRVARVGGSWDGLDLEVTTNNSASNGLNVSLVQWH